MPKNNLTNLARRYHNKLMTFIGLQLLVWSITGLYMVSMNIHYIHGETLIKNNQSRINPAHISYDINQLLSNYPNATNVEVVSLLSKPVYRFKDQKQLRIVDATNGKSINPIDQQQAIIIAKTNYAFEHSVATTMLITDKERTPSELSPRHLPVWQVTFDAISSPTLYISKQTGAIVTKRHNYWRIFDWMWRFHIMDYDDGENVANWFLLLIAVLSLIGSLAGIILTYYFVLLPKVKKGFIKHA